MTGAWGHPLAVDEDEGEGGGCTTPDSRRTMWQSPDLTWPVPLSGVG